MKLKYISLECLAATLNLPQRYLRDLVNSRKIPFLQVANRKRFNEAEVHQALVRLAEQTKGGNNER